MGPFGLDWLYHRHTKDECHFVEVVWLYGFHVMFVWAWSLQLFHWRALRLFHWRASWSLGLFQIFCVLFPGTQRLLVLRYGEATKKSSATSHGLIFIHFLVLHIPLNHMQHFASFPSTTSKSKPLGYRWILPLLCSPNHRTSLISEESISRIHTCFRYMSLSHHAPCATVAGGVYVGSTYTSICAKYFLRVIPTLARYSGILSCFRA